MVSKPQASRWNASDIIAGAIAVLIFGSLFTGAGERAPVATSETRFVEHSASGLQIVPASCESTPPYEHNSGECATIPPASSCSIVATPTTIAPGQSSTLSWNSGEASGWGTITRTIAPTVGTVGSTGTHVVSPSQTTQYTLTVDASGFLGVFGAQTYTCSATVTVDSSGSQCPSGQTWNGTQCVDDDGDGDGDGDGDSCPLGYTRVNGVCTYTGCPSGYILQGGQCIKQDTQCTATVPACGGADHTGDGVGDYVQYRTAQCQNINEYCPFGCSGGGCLPPPVSAGNITAQPALVRSGEISTITWTTSRMEPGSCSISESNPEINDNRTGVQNNGSFQTSGIQQQTVYTLRCTDLDGEIFTDSVTVNILPIFQEQ